MKFLFVLLLAAAGLAFLIYASPNLPGNRFIVEQWGSVPESPQKATDSNPSSGGAAPGSDNIAATRSLADVVLRPLNVQLPYGTPYSNPEAVLVDLRSRIASSPPSAAANLSEALNLIEQALGERRNYVSTVKSAGQRTDLDLAVRISGIRCKPRDVTRQIKRNGRHSGGRPRGHNGNSRALRTGSGSSNCSPPPARGADEAPLRFALAFQAAPSVQNRIRFPPSL